MLPYVRKFHKEMEVKEEEIKLLKKQIKLQTPEEKPYTEKDLDKIRKIIYQETRRVMEIVQGDPFVNKTELLTRSGLQRKKVLTSLNWLMENGFIVEVSCRASKTRNARFYPLTEKGHDFLKTPKSKRKPSSERFKHTYYCNKVEGWRKEQGYNPIREYGPKDDPIFSRTMDGGKVVKILKRIDVYVEIDGIKIGYEITNSFSNIITNIYKCLVIMKMDQVIIVCENQDQSNAAKEHVEKSNITEEHKGKVKYAQIGQFL